MCFRLQARKKEKAAQLRGEPWVPIYTAASNVLSLSSERLGRGAFDTFGGELLLVRATKVERASREKSLVNRICAS